MIKALQIHLSQEIARILFWATEKHHSVGTSKMSDFRFFLKRITRRKASEANIIWFLLRIVEHWTYTSFKKNCGVFEWLTEWALLLLRL